MKQLDLFTAIQNRDKGMRQAINHAGSTWKENAMRYVDEFTKSPGLYGKRFMMEEVASWAYSQGLQKPPHERSWGAVAVEAIKKGFIKRVGYGQVSNVRAHRANASIYVKS